MSTIKVPSRNVMIVCARCGRDLGNQTTAVKTRTDDCDKQISVLKLYVVQCDNCLKKEAIDAFERGYATACGHVNEA